VNYEGMTRTQDFYSNTILNHQLSQKLKLIRNDEFNHHPPTPSLGCG
jgi:hypothetical protein